MKNISTLILFCLLTIFTYSQDTFSICAIDTITGEVGSAGASCIDESAIAGGCVILSDVIPGVGVIHTQAYWNPTNQNVAHNLMIEGNSPQEIIDHMVANDVQNNPHIRQYGVVDLFEGSARCAAYTGMNCDDYKNHIIGPNYTVQGNILLGQEILDSMEYYFLNTEGELACKLMAALQGAKVIGADTRCTDDGVSSLSSFLRVGQPDDPADDLYLDLVVPSTPFGIDPIDVLQEMVDDWGGCVSSGMGKAKIKNSVKCFPNPSDGMVYFEFEADVVESVSIKIFNTVGELINTKTNIKNETASLQLNFPAGLYFYEVSSKVESLGRGKFLIH